MIATLASSIVYIALPCVGALFCCCFVKLRSWNPMTEIIHHRSEMYSSLFTYCSLVETRSQRHNVMGLSRAFVTRTAAKLRHATVVHFACPAGASDHALLPIAPCTAPRPAGAVPPAPIAVGDSPGHNLAGPSRSHRTPILLAALLCRAAQRSTARCSLALPTAAALPPPGRLWTGGWRGTTPRRTVSHARPLGRS
jgi:hypothetical protein